MRTHLIFPSHTSHRQRYSVSGWIPPHIRFEGDWTDEEKRILTDAIADAENLEASSLGHARIPWLCFCKRLSGIAVYLAHRAGWDEVMHAYGATELGLKILFVGGQPPNGSRSFTA